MNELNLSLVCTKNPDGPQNNMIPFEFENHMFQVLGYCVKDMPNSINDLELREIKHLFSKYLNVLKRTYCANIKSANRLLMMEIEDTITIKQNEVRKAKSMNAAYLLMITALGELNFIALGGMLSNIPTESNRYYSIFYSQNICQRANLICDYIREREPRELYEEVRKMRTEIRNDDKFIDWIKSDERLSPIYLKLF